MLQISKSTLKLNFSTLILPNLAWILRIINHA